MIKKIIAVVFCFSTLLGVSAEVWAAKNAAKSLNAPASTSRVTVATVTGVRGGRVTIPVTFQGDEITTYGFDADITFPTTNLTQVSTSPVAVGGATCVRMSANVVRVSIRAGSPLPGGIRYCDISFTIAVAAPGGVEPLSISNALCFDNFSVSSPCQTTSGAVNIASVQTSIPDGTNIVIAGYPGTLQASRRVRITNLGLSNLSLNNCRLDPLVQGLSLSVPNVVLPGPTNAVEAITTCALPTLGTPDLRSTLLCATSDPVRPLLRYGVTCTTVALGQPLPGDQLNDNQLAAGDQLGRSAAQTTVMTNGNSVVALGAPFAGTDRSGQVRFFEGDTQISNSVANGPLFSGSGFLSGNRLFDSAKKLRPKGDANDEIGAAVVFSPDGQRVAIGAPGAGPNDTGAVYVYQRPTSTNGWGDLDLDDAATPRTELNAPAATAALVPGQFGAQVAFTPLGDLIVGAPKTDVPAANGAGAIFRYRFVANAFVEPPEVFTSIAPATNGRFGAAIAMGPSILIVGAPEEGVLKPGASYRFRFIANEFSVPTPLPNSISQPNGLFGASVAISGDVIVVGSPGANSMGEKSGAVLFYRPSPGGQVVEGSVFIPNSGVDQRAGTSVATNGDIVIVGAPGANDGLGAGQGRVYVYPVRSTFPAQQPPIQQLRGIGTQADDRYGTAVSIDRKQAIVGTPLHDLVLTNSPSLLDVGQGDTFVLDVVFRNAFE